ncbi:MAG TPA: reverse transcriptase family protein, partial [Phormidium sp.]
IAGLLEENFAAPAFCTHPDSIVKLSVKPEHQAKIFKRQYKMPEALRTATREVIQRWFKEGRIVKAPVGCRYNTPLLVVPKYDKDGTVTGIRVCVDVRQLNKYLEQDDRFEIPNIPDILVAFKGAKLFGEFDLKEAYNQFKVAEDSQEYTAFTFESEQYMFQGCPYGIKHIPSHFQRFMTHLFQDMPFVYPYIDNIVFASKDWEEHEQHAKAIIERLTSVALKIKPSSVNLGNTEIRILGHLITQHGIGLDPEKKRLITNWPKPQYGTELASFLGLGTYLRDHVRHYADLTAPLETIKKQKVIKLDDNASQAFENVKRAFSNAPFLKFPDFTKRFCIAVDASLIGIGAVLYQPDDE